MKPFKSLETDIPNGYTNHSDSVQNPDNRIVVSKPYKTGIESHWKNKTTGDTTNSVMCISLTHNPETDNVRCIVSESPPDLSSLINVFDDPNNDYTESGYWKKIISHSYKYDSTNGKIGKYSLKSLCNKLEREHITSPKTNLYRKCLSVFAMVIVWTLVKIMKAIPYKEKLDNGEYKVHEFPLNNIALYTRARISAYHGKRNERVVDNEFKATKMSKYLGLSFMTVIAFISFTMLYIPVQLITYNMGIPSIMITAPDWTFIQIAFAIWLSVVYVVSYFCAYPLAKVFYKYVIIK